MDGPVLLAGIPGKAQFVWASLFLSGYLAREFISFCRRHPKIPRHHDHAWLKAMLREESRQRSDLADVVTLRGDRAEVLTELSDLLWERGATCLSSRGR